MQKFLDFWHGNKTYIVVCLTAILGSYSAYELGELTRSGFVNTSITAVLVMLLRLGVKADTAKAVEAVQLAADEAQNLRKQTVDKLNEIQNAAQTVKEVVK